MAISSLRDDASRLKQRYEPRNYCVQYGESDFAFVSRVMEEEGIAYWFVHAEDRHTLVLSDVPQNLSSLESPNVSFQIGSGAERKVGIWEWEKTQEVRANLYTLWDYTFESP